MPTTNPAITTTQPSIALHPTIKSAGMRGFLQWVKSDPLLSKTIWPKLQAKLASMPQPVALAGIRGLRGNYSEDMFFPGSGTGFGYLGDDSSTPNLDISAGGTDLTSSLPNVDISSSTSEAPASSSWSSSISNLISGIGAGLMTAEQLSTTNKVVNAQLSQAQAGKPPLNLSAYGLSTTPGLNLGLSSSTESMALMLGGGLLLVWLLSSMMKHKA